ncbi:MAG: extracellular solute-binding protein [bacterium]
MNHIRNSSLFSSVSLAVCLLSSTLLSQELIVFHAGSLTLPFEKILNGFVLENPGVKIQKEIAGSRECARKISELNKPCDIFASADYLVIDQLLIPRHAAWNLKFATNEMTIVYSERSRRAKEINQNNWFDILNDPHIAVGRADPNSDPCGYRTVLTLRLAEQLYARPGLALTLLMKNQKNIRPKEVDLLALLEAGEIDYIFLYRSVAEQHKLRYLLLPDSINLKKADLEEHYKQVSVQLNGKSPGETIMQAGGSMVYGVTIPNNSPNPVLAKKFIQYLMDSKRGLNVLEAMGQPTIVPSICETYDNLPDELKQYARKK